MKTYEKITNQKQIRTRILKSLSQASGGIAVKHLIEHLDFQSITGFEEFLDHNAIHFAIFDLIGEGELEMDSQQLLSVVYKKEEIADENEGCCEDSEPEIFNFEQHLQRQHEFSEKTFGPGLRTQGVIDHIRKELLEIEKEPEDLEEWIDCAILALDGAWRTGATPAQIIEKLVYKQNKNENRVWPDWRTAPLDKAIEHTKIEKYIPQVGDIVRYGSGTFDLAIILEKIDDKEHTVETCLGGIYSWYGIDTMILDKAGPNDMIEWYGNECFRGGYGKLYKWDNGE